MALLKDCVNATFVHWTFAFLCIMSLLVVLEVLEVVVGEGVGVVVVTRVKNILQRIK